MKKIVLLSVISVGLVAILTACDQKEFARKMGLNPDNIQSKSGQIVNQTYDEFSGVTRNAMTLNWLENTGYVSTVIEFNLVSIETSKTKSVQVEIKYSADNWLFIEPGESLQLITDSGVIIKLKSMFGSADRRVIGNPYSTRTGITEIAYYDISRDQAIALSKSNSIKIKLIGKTSYQTGTFSEKGLQSVRGFVSDFIQ